MTAKRHEVTVDNKPEAKARRRRRCASSSPAPSAAIPTYVDLVDEEYRYEVLLVS